MRYVDDGDGYVDAIAERSICPDAPVTEPDSEEGQMTRDQWKDLVTRLIEEFRECSCPYGNCLVYPHPVLCEAAAAVGWEPPEGQQL